VKNAEKPAVFSAKKRENRVSFLICVRMLRSRYIYTYTPTLLRAVCCVRVLQWPRQHDVQNDEITENGASNPF
jgi:hypothetical protein